MVSTQVLHPPGCWTVTVLHRSTGVLPPMQSWTPRTLIREGGTGLKGRWEEGEEGRGKKGRGRGRGGGGVRGGGGGEEGGGGGGRGSGGMANCEEAKREGGNITSACFDRETH